MEVSMLAPTDPGWTKAIGELQHDIYHTPEYVRHAADHGQADPVGVVVRSSGGMMFTPLLLRSLPESLGASGQRDAVSPYGYPGPIFAAGTSAEVKLELFESFREALAENEVISAFLRWHPLFPPTAEMVHSDGETQPGGQTVSMDLSLSDEEFASELRSGHRYEIRRLERQGFAVEMNDWSHWNGFIELYGETMQRVGASGGYYFSTQWFDRFREALGTQLHLGVVTAPSGELASASLFTERCGVIQYHLSATANAFLKLSPAKLLLACVRDWAKHRGNHTFHLGGGVGGSEDSLFRFKSGFSSRCHPFFVSRMLVDRQRYQSLVPEISEVSSSESESPASFFPAYRRAA